MTKRLQSTRVAHPHGHDAGGARPDAPVRSSAPLFHPLDQIALQGLDDDALVAYMRRARDAGHPSASDALSILVYGH